MKRLKLCIVLFFIFLSSFCFGQFKEAFVNAEELLTELLETYPGLSAAVGYGDEVIWKKGFGYADAANQILVNPDHQFRYYSLSKSITGMALIKLIEAGKLDMEKSITYYLKNLPPSYSNVKVKYLVNHTAGVRHYNGGEWMKISQDHCNNTIDALATFINDPLETTPGEVHSYTSFGYVLLSHLVTELSGQPYNSYIESTFFDPLDIRSIWPDRSESISQEVKYYTKWKLSKGKGTEAKEVNNSCKFGGGGFVGTAEAVVRLHLAMINGTFVSNEVLEQYYAAIPTAAGESTSYAFGLGDNTNDSGVRYHAHTGSALGASSVMIVYEKSETIPKPFVAVILGNLKDAEMNKHVGKLASFFRKEIEDKL